MRRQITPDKPEPADRGLLGKARQQGLQTGAPMPSFHALPAKPDIDYHRALEDSGFFDTGHPLNIRSETATAVAMVLVLLATPACENAREKREKEELQDRYAGCVNDLKRTNEELYGLTGEAANHSFAATGDTRADLETCYNTVARTKVHVGYEINKRRANATQPSPEQELGHEILQILIQDDNYSPYINFVRGAFSHRRELFDAIMETPSAIGAQGMLVIFAYLLGNDERALSQSTELGSIEYWQSQTDGGEYMFNNFIMSISEKLADSRDNQQVLNIIIYIFNNYLTPTEQAIFFQRLSATVKHFKKAVQSYKKYAAMSMQHHHDWKSGKFNAPYEDPCKKTYLHQQYEKDVKAQGDRLFWTALGEGKTSSDLSAIEKSIDRFMSELKKGMKKI